MRYNCTLSVVIPAYNVAPYVAAAVTSALNQTLTDLEVIVVEDGSTDTTAQILRDFTAAKNDPRLKIIYQRNAGLGEARNTGIMHARGKYIGFLDGDDVWHANKAERHLALLEADATISLSYSHSEYMTETGIPTGRFMLADCDEPTVVDMIHRNHIGNGSAAILRRCCFEKTGLFHKECWGYEDYEMWCRILAIGGRAKLIPEALTLYRERPTSMSYDPQLVSGAKVAVANLRAALPTLPDCVFNTGLAEAYRIAALRAISGDAKSRAIQYLIIALYNYPKLIMNWRALGTIAGLVMSRSLRLYLARRISDLRAAR
jgi:glycosyltransferase involved in cell wall biosynthesis